MSKSEKIQINTGGSTPAPAAANAPQITSFRRRSAPNRPEAAEATPSEVVSVVPKPQSKVSANEHPALDHPDARELDGGFASDMYAPGQQIHPKGTETSTTTVKSAHLVTADDDVYDPEKFHTSKFRPDEATVGAKVASMAKMNPFTLVRFWVILSVFLLTLVTGFVMLYQLEQVQAGSGIIFEWINLP